MGFNKELRPTARFKGGREGGARNVTAASTALDPRGVIGLETTSTGAPVVFTLSRVPRSGDQFFVFADSLASSSVAPFHVNAASGSFFGSSSQDMLTLPRSGDGVHIVGYSSTRWLVVGTSTTGITLSSST